jgi:ABC-type branched-subunit amino acid transport system substrate-binding protein
MRMATRYRIIVGFTALALIAASCTKSSSSSPPSSSSSSGGGGPLQIAIFESFSGANAAYGPEATAGCYPAIRLINADGGVLGRQLACIPVDSKGDPADAVPAANKLIASSSSLVGVIGAGSDTATTVVPIFEQAKIPVFSTTGQATFDQSTFQYFWRDLAPDDAQGYAMAIAAQKLGYTQAAAVFGNDIAAQGSAPTVIKGLQKLGMNLVANQALALDQGSYRSEVQKLLSAGAQVIVSEADPQTSATYLSELSQQGQLLPMVTDTVSQEPNWIKAVSGAITRAALSKLDTIVIPYAPMNTTAYTTYTQALLASSALVPQPDQWNTDLYSVADYDSTNIMALAMIAANSVNPSVYNSFMTKVTSPSPNAVVVNTFAAGKAALQAGKQIQYVGAVGPIVFDQYHNSGGGFEMIRLSTNGTEVLVGPITAADVQALSG